MSETQYLLEEEAAQYKSEYIKGEVFAMAGSTYIHLLLCNKISKFLDSTFGKKGCTLFGSDLRIQLPDQNAFVYPDLTLACKPVELLKGDTATLLNPTLVVEVLSSSTRTRDTGPKQLGYLNIPSLQYYLTVDSEVAAITLWTKKEEGLQLQQALAEGGKVAFEDGIVLTFEEVYAGLLDSSGNIKHQSELL